VLTRPVRTPQTEPSRRTEQPGGVTRKPGQRPPPDTGQKLKL
jgi:hypothetical protein